METTEKKETSTLPVLQSLGVTESQLKQLVDDYGNYLVTEDNLKEAEEVRLKLYRPRIEIQRQFKANKTIIDRFYDENKNRADFLIAISEPTEKKIAEKIASVKASIAERERMVKEAEINRIAAHQKRIQVARNIMNQGAIAETEKKLEELKQVLETNFTDHDFQEFKSEAQEVLINANTVLKQRKEFLDMKAKEVVKEEVEHHPQEISESPDTPEVVKKFETDAHPEFKDTIKESPLSKLGNGIGKNVAQQPFNFKADLVPWAYGGYNFGIDGSLDEETSNNIKHCLTEIIDNIPM